MKRGWLPAADGFPLQVHAAVVGVDPVHRAGVGLVVGAGVEDHDLDGAVVVVRDGAVVTDHVVEVGVLVAQAAAAGGQLARGHLLRLDGDAGAAWVGHRQDGAGQLGLEVAGAVVGAVGLVVVVGHLGDTDPQRGRPALDGAGVEQAAGQRADLGAQCGMLQEPAEFTSRVRREVGLVRSQQREVAAREVVERVDQAGVRLHGTHERGHLVTAEGHRVHVVDRVEHPPRRVPGGVVVRQQSLDDVDVAGVLLGAVDERDGLGERLAVGVVDVAGARAGEEGVEPGAYRGLQAAAVGAHRAGVVVVHVVAGAQVEHELRHTGGGVARVGRRAVAQGVGDRGHLRLTEGVVGVVPGQVEQGVDAVGRGRLDLLDQRAAAPAGEVGDVARGGTRTRVAGLAGDRLVRRLRGTDWRLRGLAVHLLERVLTRGHGRKLGRLRASLRDVLRLGGGGLRDGRGSRVLPGRPPRRARRTQCSRLRWPAATAGPRSWRRSGPAAAPPPDLAVPVTFSQRLP